MASETSSGTYIIDPEKVITYGYPCTGKNFEFINGIPAKLRAIDPEDVCKLNANDQSRFIQIAKIAEYVIVECSGSVNKALGGKILAVPVSEWGNFINCKLPA